MFRKELFVYSHQFKYGKFPHMYNSLIQNQWKSYDELKKGQERKLAHMMNFVYDNVPYYHKLFNSLNLKPDDLKKVEDLEKLPILTKDIINKNWEDFKPINLNNIDYYNNSTGGTSGTPLRYRWSKNDRFLGASVLYRGWGYGGYELGDKMVFLAGSSLNVGTNSLINKKCHEILRNLKKFSSFDMSPSDMQSYIQCINSFKPKFLRGYPTSIYYLSQFIKENDFEVHSPISVFTTSEKLTPHARKEIESIFSCDVFDNYGLNDGGVSSFECKEHNGLHIDTERSIMEVVDENNSQIDNGIGRILATSLNNYSMPFIRYESGDMGHIIEDKCGCGRNSKLLKEVLGRTVDVLYTPEGKSVHGWFFLYIMWEYCKGIEEYQVIQERLDKIIIKLVISTDFDDSQLGKIIDIAKGKSEGWNIEFKFVDKIDRSKAGKYKFIINNICSPQ